MIFGNTNKGFTLLEVLIVVVIIGIATTLVTLRYTSRASSDRLEEEAKRLVVLIKHAQRTALLESIALGITIEPTSYFFSKQIPPNNRFEKITDTNTSLKERHLPDGITADLRLDDQKPTTQPALLIVPSENIASFKIILQDKNINTTYEVTLDESGEVVWIHAD